MAVVKPKNAKKREFKSLNPRYEKSLCVVFTICNDFFITSIKI